MHSTASHLGDLADIVQAGEVGDDGVGLGANMIGHFLSVAVATQGIGQARLQGNKSQFIKKSSELVTGVVQSGAEAVETAIKIIESSSSTGTRLAVASSIVSKVGVTGMFEAFLIAASISLTKLRSIYSSVKGYLNKTERKRDPVAAFKQLSGRLEVNSEDRKTLLEQIFNLQEPWYKKSTLGVVAEKRYPDDSSESKKCKIGTFR